MKIKAFGQRHPLATYFGLAYAIAWSGSLLLAGATRFQGQAVPTEQVILLLLLMLAAPSTASYWSWPPWPAAQACVSWGRG
jgi:hypothetical protein